MTSSQRTGGEGEEQKRRERRQRMERNVKGEKSSSMRLKLSSLMQCCRLGCLTFRGEVKVRESRAMGVLDQAAVHAQVLTAGLQ